MTFSLSIYLVCWRRFIVDDFAWSSQLKQSAFAVTPEASLSSRSRKEDCSGVSPTVRGILRKTCWQRSLELILRHSNGSSAHSSYGSSPRRFTYYRFRHRHAEWSVNDVCEVKRSIGMAKVIEFYLPANFHKRM